MKIAVISSANIEIPEINILIIEKIISCLALNRIISFEEANLILDAPGKNFDRTVIHKQKLHTLRDDINDRWHRGIMIDYFINVNFLYFYILFFILF